MSKKETLDSVFRFLGIMLLAFWVSGCGENRTHYLGWVTSTVDGYFRLEEEKPNTTKIILVREYQRTFIVTSKGNLDKINAKLIYPDKNGYFRTTFPSDVYRLDIYFVARGYLHDVASFSRTLGVGRIHYVTTLKNDPNWKENLAVQIHPFLSGYIVEKGYSMPPKDQLFLGKWLNENQK